jgi:hypothetical protein
LEISLNPRSPRVQEFAAARANSLSEEARGGRDKANRGLGQAREPPDSATTGHLRTEKPPITANRHRRLP